MKKLIFMNSLVFFLVTSLFAQITVVDADMPAVGDTIRISTGLNLDFIDYEETGEDYLWDFSEVTSVTQRLEEYVNVTQTPFFYWPFFLLNANLASPIIGDSIFPGVPLTDVYNFYNNSNSNYLFVGFAATISGIPLPIKYDNPDVLYEFPMDYGNVDSSASGLAFGLPDIGYILIDKKRKNTVDGWGTLKTPYGTFDVLRVKSEVMEYDSIYLDSLQAGIPINREYTEYKWLGKDQGLPLLTVTDDLFGLVVEYIDSARNITTDVPEYKNQHDAISVYPNPSPGVINITLNRETKAFGILMILDLDGKMVLQKSFDRSRSVSVIKLDLLDHHLKPGQYFLVIKMDNRLYTKKLIYSP